MGVLNAHPTMLDQPYLGASEPGTHGPVRRSGAPVHRRSIYRTDVLSSAGPRLPRSGTPSMSVPASPTARYAELHCHTNFSFLDGASAADNLVDRAVELGLTALAVTDHQGLYGVVRFSTAAREAGIRPVIGLELELVDASAPDPDGIVVPGSSTDPARRATRLVRRPRRGAPQPPGRRRPGPAAGRADAATRSLATSSRGTCAAWARDDAVRTWSSWPATGPATEACAGSSAGRTWPGRRASRGTPRPCSPNTSRASWRCRDVATARSPGGSGSATGTGRGSWPRAMPGCSARARPPAGRRGSPPPASCSSSSTTSCPTTTGWWPRRPAWPRSSGCRSWSRTTSTTPFPEDRELQDVLAAIRHGRTVGTLADLRRPDGESYLKSAAELLALPPADPVTEADDPRTSRSGSSAGAKWPPLGIRVQCVRFA